MTDGSERSPWLPPRWFIRFAWKAHRAWYRVTGGRRWTVASTSRPLGDHAGDHDRTSQRPGALGDPGLPQDGANLFTLAMNGWGEAEPAWWLNLQANPQAGVRLADGTREVVAHAATGNEQDRLWERWRGIDKNLDRYAHRRPNGTAVVVLSSDFRSLVPGAVPASFGAQEKHEGHEHDQGPDRQNPSEQQQSEMHPNDAYQPSLGRSSASKDEYADGGLEDHQDTDEQALARCDQRVPGVANEPEVSGIRKGPVIGSGEQVDGVDQGASQNE